MQLRKKKKIELHIVGADALGRILYARGSSPVSSSCSSHDTRLLRLAGWNLEFTFLCLSFNSLLFNSQTGCAIQQAKWKPRVSHGEDRPFGRLHLPATSNSNLYSRLCTLLCLLPLYYAILAAFEGAAAPAIGWEREWAALAQVLSRDGKRGRQYGGPSSASVSKAAAAPMELYYLWR